MMTFIKNTLSAKIIIYYPANNQIIGPAHEILAFITHANQPPLNNHADASRGPRGLNIGSSLDLLPFFMYARREGCGETARTHRLV